jgi:hypothetical protein
MPGRILCYVLMIIQWVVIHQSEQNDHRRDQCACALYVCYARPSFRLWLHVLQYKKSLGRIFGAATPPGALVSRHDAVGLCCD